MATAERNRQPLYRQVADEIREAISQGVWPPGTQMPSEPDLARHYAVSRATVREALRVLEQDRMVTATRGLGTFVRSTASRPYVGIDTLYSITQVIRRQGYLPSTTDVRITRTVLKAAFGDSRFPGQPKDYALLPPEEPVAVIERTRRADGRPVAYTHDAVPLRYLSEPGWEERVAKSSLFDLLREGGVEVDHTCTRLYSTAAPREAAKRLELKEGSPVMMTEETVYDQMGQPVVVARDFYSTDHIEVMVVRTRS
ncbi:MAG TPA: GntR family transcriptional regulator [Symbiobacteriaceae bacterium]|nr:GntR family transcriptional regulator [Symbiobacteriaceae bacterium]